jgi:hypothetical protein
MLLGIGMRELWGDVSLRFQGKTGVRAESANSGIVLAHTHTHTHTHTTLTPPYNALPARGGAVFALDRFRIAAVRRQFFPDRFAVNLDPSYPAAPGNQYKFAAFRFAQERLAGLRRRPIRLLRSPRPFRPSSRFARKGIPLIPSIFHALSSITEARLFYYINPTCYIMRWSILHSNS